MLELTGSYERRVEDLETGESRSFVDTSLSTPWTYVRALSAALGSRDAELVRRLIELPEALWAARERAVSESPLLYARALRAAAQGEEAAARSTLAALREAAGGDPGDPYWTAHADALEAALAGDREQAAEAAARGIRHYYGQSPPPELLPELLLLGALALSPAR